MAQDKDKFQPWWQKPDWSEAQNEAFKRKIMDHLRQESIFYATSSTSTLKKAVQESRDKWVEEDPNYTEWW